MLQHRQSLLHWKYCGDIVDHRLAALVRCGSSPKATPLVAAASVFRKFERGHRNRFRTKSEQHHAGGALLGRIIWPVRCSARPPRVRMTSFRLAATENYGMFDARKLFIGAVCAIVCATANLCASNAAAQTIDLSLNVLYSSPSDVNSGGTWLLVAKSSNFGIAGLSDTRNRH